MAENPWETGLKLRSAFCQETSELPEQWSADNRSIGQCHVSALVLQDLYGGDILVGRAMTWNGRLPAPITHYWNVIDGVTLDITRDQFPPTTAIAYILPADDPLTITRDKADLLARLAGVRS